MDSRDSIVPEPLIIIACIIAMPAVITGCLIEKAARWLMGEKDDRR